MSLLGPIALVVAAVAAVAVGAVLVIKNWGPISSFFVGLWNNIKEFSLKLLVGVQIHFPLP